MKKLFIIAFGLFSLFSFGFAENFTIDEYLIQGDILEDGTIKVQEDINTNFTQYSHGIKRNIPFYSTVTNGNDKTSFKLVIDDAEVKGDDYEILKDTDYFTFKIGDPDREIIGDKKYHLSYSAYGLVRNFSGMGYAELYWNPVGTEWQTSIEKTKIILNLPKNYRPSDDDILVLAGKGGMAEAKFFQGDIKISNKQIIITYNHRLNARQGITIALKFPNNYFTFDHQKQAALLAMGNGGYYTTPNLNLISLIVYLIGGGLCCIFMIIMIKRFQKRRKKPDIITVQYTSPEKISASEAGILIDDIIDPKDISCMFYEWTVKGIIKIEKTKEGGFLSDEEYTITKIKNPPDFPSYQSKFFYALFKKNSTRVLKKYDSTLGDLFYQCSEDLSKFVHTEKRYTTNDLSESSSFSGASKGMCFLSALGIGVYYSLAADFVNEVLYLPINDAWEDILLLSVLFMLSWIWVGFFRKDIKTEKGKELYAGCLGYKEFIDKCDKQKLKTFLEEDPLFVDKTLPYAVVFGLESQFIKKVSPLIEKQYGEEKLDYYSLLFDSASLIRDFTTDIAQKNLSYTSNYSSSGGFSSGSSFGGGFSGGGGGGGGGGSSW